MKGHATSCRAVLGGTHSQVCKGMIEVDTRLASEEGFFPEGSDAFGQNCDPIVGHHSKYRKVQMARISLFLHADNPNKGHVLIRKHTVGSAPCV